MGVTDQTRSQIASHYYTHVELYRQIWRKLEAIRERFHEADREGKIAYLQLSYMNAVISIRTEASRQDEAVRRLMAGDDLETALESVNYYRQKANAIRNTLQRETVWHEIVSTLEDEAIDVAHESALDGLKYVGPVKAPFVFAMLGYTEKMCIDSNVVQVVGMDEWPDTTEVDRYEEICQRVRNQFPVLSKELDPFHLHWVVFDWHRYHDTGTGKTQKARTPVTLHDAWFDAALRDPSEIKGITESIT